jgi:hypothetical protein
LYRKEVINMKNQRRNLTDTIGAFLHKELSYGGSLMSDGGRLYSYLVVIGEWDGDVVKLPQGSLEYRRTTTRHCSMLKAMAATQGIQIIEV